MTKRNVPGKELTQAELEQQLNEMNTDDNLYEEEKEMLDTETPATPAIDYDKIDLSLYSEEDQVKHLSHMTGKQIQSALMRAKQPNDVKPKKAEKETFRFTSIPEGTKISLAQLIHLDKTPVKDAHMAMRPLDKDTVQSLLTAYESGDPERIAKIPPMEIQGSTQGYIIVSGHNREEAQRQAVENTFLNNPLMVDKDGMMTQSAFKMYQDALKNFYITYKAVNMPESDIVTYMFSDNLTHGKAPDDGSRSAFALYWYQTQRKLWKEGKGPKVTMEMAASKFGTSRKSLVVRNQKNKGIKPGKKAVVVPDSDLDASDLKVAEDIIDSMDAKLQPGVLEGGFTRIINAAVKIADEQISESELNAYVQDMIKTEQQYKALLLMTRILQVVPPTPPVTTTK